MNKTAIKFLGAAVILVVLGVGALRGIEYYQYRKSPEYALMRHYQKLQEAYQADTYGGDTPEETLRLFIDALKKGDIDLASKYFVVDEWEKEKEYLSELKQKDNFSLAISDSDKLKLSKKTDAEAFFTAVGPRGVVEIEVILAKNKYTSKWKILEL